MNDNIDDNIENQNNRKDNEYYSEDSYLDFLEAEKEFEASSWSFGSLAKPTDDFESMEYLPGENQSKNNDRGYGM